jgi:hypothetical protein
MKRLGHLIFIALLTYGGCISSKEGSSMIVKPGTKDGMGWIGISLVLVVMVFACTGFRTVYRETTVKENEVIMNIPQITGEVASIDIKMDKFFWLVQPWKEGKLATIDGWGRFSEISFEGPNGVILTPLVEFPRMRMDRSLRTWPEAGVFFSQSGQTVHLADVDAGTTKSFIPYLTWQHWDAKPVLVDPDEGLMAFVYRANKNDTCHTVIYNYKTDTTVHESPPESNEYLGYVIAPDNILSKAFSGDVDKRKFDIFFYNWKTGERLRNNLTKRIVDLGLRGITLQKMVDLSWNRRYLVVDLPWVPGKPLKKIKMDWDEEYEHIKVTPLEYLMPEEKYFENFFLSSDGQWATCFVTGYRGLYGESLVKRAFFHMDGRYPNGISMPVFADGYEQFHWDYAAFVEHPVYGLCHASEYHRAEDGKDQLYLRLYKMDDVLSEINRRLADTAEPVME